jgi:membrane protein implicated in regulation of membrane protease activity
MDGAWLGRMAEYMPVIWIAALAVFVLVEVLTQGLTTIWFAIGALAAFAVSLLGGLLIVQIVLWLAVSILMICFTRPIVVRKLRVGREKNVTDQMAGRVGLVTETVLPFGAGLVKVGGVFWTAVGETPEEEIPKGSRVSVIRIEGVKIVVRPETERKLREEAADPV